MSMRSTNRLTYMNAPLRKPWLRWGNHMRISGRISAGPHSDPPPMRRIRTLPSQSLRSLFGLRREQGNHPVGKPLDREIA